MLLFSRYVSKSVIWEPDFAQTYCICRTRNLSWLRYVFLICIRLSDNSLLLIAPDFSLTVSHHLSLHLPTSTCKACRINPSAWHHSLCSCLPCPHTWCQTQQSREASLPIYFFFFFFLRGIFSAENLHHHQN